ncbi:hypothetical protein MAUB1S_01789 [Mycolicibacterium aubagnense]
MTAPRLEPPRPLGRAARKHWDRIAQTIRAQGRFASIDADLLAIYCETLVLYLAAKSEVDKYGILVEGRTSSRELVRNPALTPMNQLRTDLIRLAKAIPIADTSAASRDGAQLDDYLAQWTAEYDAR